MGPHAACMLKSRGRVARSKHAKITLLHAVAESENETHPSWRARSEPGGQHALERQHGTRSPCRGGRWGQCAASWWGCRGWCRRKQARLMMSLLVVCFERERAIK